MSLEETETVIRKGSSRWKRAVMVGQMDRSAVLMGMCATHQSES